MDNVNCFGYETSLTQCRQVGWGQGNCDPFHREDAGVVCDNTTVEEVSNNYCRNVNNGSCLDRKVCEQCEELEQGNISMLMRQEGMAQRGKSLQPLLSHTAFAAD